VHPHLVLISAEEILFYVITFHSEIRYLVYEIQVVIILVGNNLLALLSLPFCLAEKVLD